MRARGDARDGGGADEKDSIKRLCLSPYVEIFNSKIVKGFVPEQRSRYVFSNFEIPMFCVYMLPTFDVHFAHGRIWLWYICLSRSFVASFLFPGEQSTAFNEL